MCRLSFCFKIPWTPGDLWPQSTYVHKVSDRPNCWSQTHPGAWYSPHEEQAAEEQLLMKCLKKLQGRHKPALVSGRERNCNSSSSLGTLLLVPLSAFPPGPAPVSAAVALSLHWGVVSAPWTATATRGELVSTSLSCSSYTHAVSTHAVRGKEVQGR